jgi:hypothetical protein
MDFESTLVLSSRSNCTLSHTCNLRQLFTCCPKGGQLAIRHVTIAWTISLQQQPLPGRSYKRQSSRANHIDQLAEVFSPVLGHACLQRVLQGIQFQLPTVVAIQMECDQSRLQSRDKPAVTILSTPACSHTSRFTSSRIQPVTNARLQCATCS